jgi:hypothetical protein
VKSHTASLSVAMHPTSSRSARRRQALEATASGMASPRQRCPDSSVPTVPRVPACRVPMNDTTVRGGLQAVRTTTSVVPEPRGGQASPIRSAGVPMVAVPHEAQVRAMGSGSQPVVHGPTIGVDLPAARTAGARTTSFQYVSKRPAGCRQHPAGLCLTINGLSRRQPDDLTALVAHYQLTPYGARTPTSAFSLLRSVSRRH